MPTAQDVHEQWTMHHLHAKQWDEVSPIAKRIYEALAQAIEVETSSIDAAMCFTCNKMIDAYEYADHTCRGENNG